MRFSSAFVLASLIVCSFGATVADLKADIAAINTQLTALNNAINAFTNPGGTLLQALAIHTAATNVDSAVKKANTDGGTVTPKPLAEADGRAILDALEGLEPSINSALTNIVAKKPAIDALPLGGVPALVRQDLATLNTDTTALENTLIAASPADLVSEANALKNRINARFATAIAAYGA